jgi:hypothetical protein
MSDITTCPKCRTARAGYFVCSRCGYGPMKPMTRLSEERDPDRSGPEWRPAHSILFILCSVVVVSGILFVLFRCAADFYSPR